MKIAQVLGRGIEGVGVTRYVIELNSYLNRNKIDNDIFVVTDKKWGREKAQNFPEYEEINEESIELISEKLNSYDYVFIHSVPSIKHSEIIIEKFFELVKNVTSKKVIFQNDHKIQSIRRNANFIEMCQYCDKIVSHSDTSPFYKKLVNVYGNSILSKFVHLHVMYDYSNILKYRKEEHLSKISYLGRFATFKDPGRLLKILDKTKTNNIHMDFVGVERSIGATSIFYKDYENRVHNDDLINMDGYLRKDDVSKYDFDENNRDISKIYSFGAYQYDKGLSYVSNSLVACDFYNLDADAYGDNVEYAQCEIVGMGCIPLFDSHWGENCYVFENGKKTNTRFIDLDNFGLFLKKDISNVDEVIEEFIKLRENKSLQEIYRKNSFEIMKGHSDIDWICEQLLNDIQCSVKLDSKDPFNLLF